MFASTAPDSLVARARALAAAGAWDELRALLGERAREAGAHPELVTLLAEAFLRTRDPRHARTWLRRTLRRVERSGDRAALRRAVNLSGAAYFELGELEDARRDFSRALELGREDADDLLVARATNNLGLIENIRGMYDAALALYQLAVPSYQRLGHALGLAESYHNMAISFRDSDQLERADECERRAAEFAREAGNPRLATMARVGRAELSFRRGDAELAAAEARAAARQFAAIGDPTQEADALRLCGVAALALGHLEDARVALDGAVELARAHGNALMEAESLRARAECAAAAGDAARSRDDADRALAIFVRLGSSREAGELRDWMAGAPRGEEG